MIFFSKFQFTYDLHGVANQENNIYCDFYWKGNYIAFLEKIAFLKSVLQRIL